jgi:Ca2+-binding RTX toxin-like protein
LSKGDGTFQAAKNFPVSLDNSYRRNPGQVVIADFDGDKRQDLATSNRGGGLTGHSGVSVLLGKGDGSFQEALEFSFGVNPSSLTTADLDGIDSIDLAVADEGSNDLNFEEYPDNVSVVQNLIPPDMLAPRVQAVSPANLTTGVSLTAKVEATFSEDMDRSTLTSSTFTLAKQGSTSPVAAHVAYDSVNRKATLDPDSDLEANTSYTARVKGGTSGVKDLTGNALEQDHSWAFTTAAPPPPVPDTTITSGPSGTVDSTSASFGFSSNDSGAAFECKLDGGAFAGCTSPKSYTALSQGTHTFEVRATNSAGPDPTPANRTWTVAVPAPKCTKTGTANSETISGTAGDDVICAGGGDDTLKGLGGNDTLKGEDGNDTLLGGIGNDKLDGGLGTDTASYSASLTAVIASLATNSATGEGSDTFLGLEALLGSPYADTLTGSAANNTLTGGGGNDAESGGSGNDKVVGSGGADTLKGEDGADTVDSRDFVNGNDSLDGGAGTDTKVTDSTEKSIVGFP